ncbi:MAG TPA: mitofilin family membrane protein [Acetobacteraceae bacterium]|nr:mitofilin family membrane protein [Acetobacteraceae bacterium]
MSDAPALPPPEEEPPAEPAPPPPPEPERPARRPLLPWLTAAGFIILAVAIVWVWRHPIVQPASTEATDALGRQVSALEARVTQLEQRPESQVPDLAPLAARVTALEQRPVPQPSTAVQPPPDLGPLEARVAALEQRQPPDLQPLENRLAALEAKQQQTETNLSGQIAALENDSRTMRADVSHRADAAASAAKHTALVESAALALSAGQKLGDLPGAPPALSRFADANPPTLASLRLTFPAAAREALGAARPATEGKPLATRLWAQAQDLVTIRQGDKVLVGDPAAGALERARDALNAGDLGAAVAAVGSLQGAAAQAMAGWLAEARALLAARAALAAWAASD